VSSYDPNYVDVPVYFRLGIKTVIVNSDNKILLLQRSDKTSSPHSWDFGGGGVDKSENPVDSAIREAKEETGLNIHDLRPLTTYLDTESKDEAVIIGFTAHTNSSDVKLSWEHEAFRWLTREELNEMQLPDLHDSIRKAFLQLPF